MATRRHRLPPQADLVLNAVGSSGLGGEEGRPGHLNGVVRTGGLEGDPGQGRAQLDESGQGFAMGLYGGLVAVVGCSFDQVGRGPGPPHHQLVDHSQVNGAHGQHSLNQLERPDRVVLSQQDLGQGLTCHDPGTLLEVGQQLPGPQDVISRRVVRASTDRQRRCLEPDHHLIVGEAAGRQTCADDALGLAQVPHAEQRAGQHGGGEHRVRP